MSFTKSKEKIFKDIENLKHSRVLKNYFLLILVLAIFVIILFWGILFDNTLPKILMNAITSHSLELFFDYYIILFLTLLIIILLLIWNNLLNNKFSFYKIFFLGLLLGILLNIIFTAHSVFIETNLPVEERELYKFFISISLPENYSSLLSIILYFVSSISIASLIFSKKEKLPTNTFISNIIWFYTGCGCGFLILLMPSDLIHYALIILIIILMSALILAYRSYNSIIKKKLNTKLVIIKIIDQIENKPPVIGGNWLRALRNKERESKYFLPTPRYLALNEVDIKIGYSYYIIEERLSDKSYIIKGVVKDAE